jgi:hypothetical protein
MKTRFLLSTGSALLLMLTLIVSCKDSSVQIRKYQANVPKYMSYEDLRKPVKSAEAYPVASAGKIYVQGKYLFVNEKYKGIHVFDNTNPEAPVNLTFIDIPGNVDLAVKGNYLYADNYVDLVVLDITDLNNPIEISRVKDVFPYTIPEPQQLNYPISSIDQQQGVIVGWEVREVTEEISDYQPLPYYYFDQGSGGFFMSQTVGGSPATTQSVGIGGSLARFMINGNQFYGLNQYDMRVIDISQPFRPVAGKTIPLNRTVETVFMDSTRLFIGTQTGMLIYDVSDAASPVYLSEYNHFQSCDPVVVKDGLAYVTLRAGNMCGAWQNLLEVIDLHNIMSPVLLKDYPMTSPYGLGISDKTLFVCDGSDGLKVYDATDPLQIDQHMLKQYSSLQAVDVIPLDGLLIMIAADGIYQYDYSDLQNIHLLSTIPVSGK